MPIGVLPAVGADGLAAPLSGLGWRCGAFTPRSYKG